MSLLAVVLHRTPPKGCTAGRRATRQWLRSLDWALTPSAGAHRLLQGPQMHSSARARRTGRGGRAGVFKEIGVFLKRSVLGCWPATAARRRQQCLERQGCGGLGLLGILSATIVPRETCTGRKDSLTLIGGPTQQQSTRLHLPALHTEPPACSRHVPRSNWQQTMDGYGSQAGGGGQVSESQVMAAVSGRVGPSRADVGHAATQLLPLLR